MKAIISITEYAIGGSRGAFVDHIYGDGGEEPTENLDGFPSWTQIQVEVPAHLQAETAACINQMPSPDHPLLRHCADEIRAAKRRLAVLV